MKKNYKIDNDCRGMYEDEIVQKILESRNIKDIDRFLNPSENDLLPLDSLYKIGDAAKIVIDGIMQQKKFMVLYDTDTDGISSGTIIMRYLNDYGITPEWYINNGKDHGCSEELLDELTGIGILIIVDSLDSDTNYYEEINSRGIQIVVLDHHDVNPDINYDDYVTLVSSNRNYKNSSLSGAGVVWKFCKYIDALTGTVYADQYVDLAACGILADVCDISENSYENRYIVNKGLDNRVNPAIAKILGGYVFNSTSVLYSIAPLINASNRMNKNDIAVKAFLSNDNKDVLKYIKILKQSKEEQNEEVSNLLPDILEQCKKQQNDKVIITIIGKYDNRSLTGLLGNKLMSIYQKPIFVLKKYKDCFSGSCRAIGVENFKDLCNETKLCSANGHESAFGIVIKNDLIDEFKSKLELLLKDIEFEVSEEVDAEINVEDLTEELVEKIKPIEKINGKGFKPIVFSSIIDDYVVGSMSNGKHLTLTCQDNKMMIMWNFNGDFEEIEDHGILGDSIKCIGTLQSGFLARKYYLQMIMNDFEVLD